MRHLLGHLLALLVIFNLASILRADIYTPEPPSLAIAVDGPSLEFTFKNPGRAWIKIMSHMETSDAPQYDQMTLLAVDSGGIVHPLQFVDERLVSIADYEVINPGKSYSEKINLAEWNGRAITKYKFREGTDYTFILVYNDKDWDAGPHFGTVYSSAIRVHYAAGKFTAKK